MMTNPEISHLSSTYVDDCVTMKTPLSIDVDGDEDNRKVVGGLQDLSSAQKSMMARREEKQKALSYPLPYLPRFHL